MGVGRWQRRSILGSLLLGIGLLIFPFLMRADEIASVGEECTEKAYHEKTLCYQKQLEHILKTQGTEQALTVLEQLAAQDPDVLRDAHSYAHHLGRTSFSHYQDAATAFSHCRNTFWSGCYHGVLEGYLRNLPRVEPKDIATLCQTSIDAQQSTFLEYQCLHGLGHGLTMYFQHNVPKALSFCDALRTNWERQSCYGGVFMENIVAFQNPHPGHHESHTGHPHLLDPHDLLYPCTAVQKKYQRACYLMQSSAILTLTNYDFTQTFQECAKAPPEFVSICYQSMGRDISGFTLRDVQQVIELCGLGSQDAVRHCFAGAAKDFILTHADPQRGFTLCSQVPEPAKKDCYAAAGAVLGLLYPDQESKEKACAGAEQAYIAVCAASLSSESSSRTPPKARKARQEIMFPKAEIGRNDRVCNETYAFP